MKPSTGGEQPYRSNTAPHKLPEKHRDRAQQHDAQAARTCRGWPASGPGRLPPGPCPLTGVPAEAPGSSVTSRVRSPGTFHLCSLSSVTVTLEAGGADTHTQRAISGSEPSQDSCTFRRHPT